MITPLALGMPGLDEWLVIAFVGLLLFGKRLPEVGRSLGKGIVEFKKGLAGIDDEIATAKDKQNALPSATQPQILPPPQQAQATQSADPNHRFDPYTGKPLRFDPYTGKPLNDETVASTSTSPSDENDSVAS